MRVLARFVTAVALCAGLGPAALASDQPMIGDQAPPFELQSLEGETVSLAGLHGKLVVVHFGADW